MALGDVRVLRDAIKTRLATVTGLRCYDTVPDKPEFPAAIVMPPERIDFDTTFGRGSDMLLIRVQLLVPRSTDRVPQDTLDQLIAGTGALSVKTAIEGDDSLGGRAQTVRVVRMENYGVTELADGQTKCLGAQLVLEVYA